MLREQFCCTGTKISANVKQAANQAIPGWTFITLNGLFPWCLRSLQICLESLTHSSKSPETRLLNCPFSIISVWIFLISLLMIINCMVWYFGRLIFHLPCTLPEDQNDWLLQLRLNLHDRQTAVNTLHVHGGLVYMGGLCWREADCISIKRSVPCIIDKMLWSFKFCWE